MKKPTKNKSLVNTLRPNNNRDESNKNTLQEGGDRFLSLEQREQALKEHREFVESLQLLLREAGADPKHPETLSPYKREHLRLVKEKGHHHEASRRQCVVVAGRNL